MKRVGVLTSSRADYTGLRPVIGRLFASTVCEPLLIATGTHLSDAHGRTIREIEQDGFEVSVEVPLPMRDDSPQSIARDMAEVTARFGELFADLDLDVLLVLGDRFEVHAAVSAACPFVLPVAHIHGGEVTFGAIDEGFRHSITKLSHLHFVATAAYAKRVEQLGEEPWRITVSGAPALDNLASFEIVPRSDLGVFLVIDLQSRQRLAVVTYHPSMLSTETQHVEELLLALHEWQGQIVITSPNADAGNSTIRTQLIKFAGTHPERIAFTQNLGPSRFFSLLKIADVMVGNSSSGLIEAPSFQLPVVNIGARQEGRVRARNVIDVPLSKEAISRALAKAMEQDFLDELKQVQNPYGDGRASERIVSRLESETLDEKVTRKIFVDKES